LSSNPNYLKKEKRKKKRKKKKRKKKEEVIKLQITNLLYDPKRCIKTLLIRNLNQTILSQSQLGHGNPVCPQ
jgi:hypothetical protein